MKYHKAAVAALLLAAGGFYAELYNSQFASCNDRFEE